ncbi:MAG TPA: G1 family glutamic endopeptidase, partial [Galbitalea sp.]|nr:G1 family glutamic endopeptidase [Galbitalea sp.]
MVVTHLAEFGDDMRSGHASYPAMAAAMVLLVLATATNVRTSTAGISGPRVSAEDCGGGISAVRITPAAGFDPLSATDAQLERNGYAPRPDNHADLRIWQHYVTSPIHRRSTCAALSADRVDRAPQNSINWAGYQVTGHPFKNATAQWHVGGPISDTDHPNAQSSTWVGIGTGDSRANALVQAGTSSDGETSSNDIHIWWEVYPYNHSQVVSADVQAGDLMSTTVSATATQASMHITNLTRGFDRTYTFALTTSWSAGGHAEWILERPASVSNNNTHPYLAATFDTTFTGARTKWGTSSYTAIGSLTH